MVDFTDCEDLAVTIWVRKRAATGAAETPQLLETLRDLQASGKIDNLSVNVWTDEIQCDPDKTLPGSKQEIRNRIDEFQEWAEEKGHDLEPAFRWCEKSTLVDDETHEVIVPPFVCLEIRSDEELLAVFPCTSDDGTQTVSQCIERLKKLNRTVDRQLQEAE